MVQIYKMFYFHVKYYTHEMQNRLNSQTENDRRVNCERVVQSLNRYGAKKKIIKNVKNLLCHMYN